MSEKILLPIQLFLGCNNVIIVRKIITIIITMIFLTIMLFLSAKHFVCFVWTMYIIVETVDHRCWTTSWWWMTSRWWMSAIRWNNIESLNRRVQTGVKYESPWHWLRLFCFGTKSTCFWSTRSLMADKTWFLSWSRSRFKIQYFSFLEYHAKYDDPR